MRIENKKKYPIALLRSIATINKKFYNLCERNSDIVGLEDNESILIIIRDKDEKNFYFTINNPRLDSNRNSYFDISYCPSNENSISGTQTTYYEKDISKIFNSWIKLIREYDNIELTVEEKFQKIYEEEFFSEFEIIDEDAEVAPFNNKQQLFLYKYLSHIESKLLEADPEDLYNKTLFEDTSNLKNNLQNLTKKEVIQRISKLLAKIKKKGLKLLLDVFDVAKKEAIKKALNQEVVFADSLIDLIS